LAHFGSNKVTLDVTVTDQFCGCGGSTSGAIEGGAVVKLAMNHWELAIKSHNTNFPSVAHDCADMSAVDPRRYFSTDILITSPECTNHSQAKGKKRRNLAQLELFGTTKIDPAEERSRATMWDVVRFAEVHKYRLIIVENVVDAAKWILFDEWLNAMRKLDYLFEPVFFNSMFSHPVPQSRDRMYMFFWKKNHTAPDLEFRPTAFCDHCCMDVEARQWWKNGMKWGRYGDHGQYLYLCSKCGQKVTPYYYCAANIVDWSLPSVRIGDRQKPLAPRTIKRIEYGLNKFQDQPMTVQVDYTHSDSPRTRPLTDTMATMTTRQVHGLVTPPWLLAYYTREDPNSSLEDPIPTVPTENRFALVEPHRDSFLSYYYGNSQASPMSDAIDTVTTKDKCALVTSATNVDDCHFRMLQPHEIQKAMSFPDDYVVLGSKRHKVKQLGNAVTPPVIKMLINRALATFN
jgi:DNA (cytosine-5)-methyltransferase 1